jgi:molybdopterin-guanine dinucleotide biosynthesis protein
LFRNTEETMSLDEIIATFPETDSVLVEGFHLEPRAKIEVLSDQNSERLRRGDENLLAIVGSTGHDEGRCLLLSHRDAAAMETRILKNKGNAYGAWSLLLMFRSFKPRILLSHVCRSNKMLNR